MIYLGGSRVRAMYLNGKEVQMLRDKDKDYLPFLVVKPKIMTLDALATITGKAEVESNRSWRVVYSL